MTETTTADARWRRLDPRMLLIHPVREIVRYIPVLIVTVIVGSRSDSPLWGLAVLAVIVGLALARWFTTTYRIEPENVRLRSGLLQRRTLTVPRSRIRSVDVHADPLHRLLGLAELTIGTGQQAEGEERFHLDGVATGQVPELRALLLSGRTEDAAPQPIPPSTGRPEPDEGVDIAQWRPAWVRYAPLSLTGLAIVGATVGLAFQYGVAQLLLDSPTVQDLGGRGAVFLAVLVSIAVVVLIGVTTIAACVHYLTTYFGLRVLDDGKTLHIRHGLLTTRQTTLDLARLRGATVKEPLLLRLAGAAELEAVMTGTSPRQKILPQAPRAAVERTLAKLLSPPEDVAPPNDPRIRSAAAPALVALTPHGPRARRRRYTRALSPVLLLAAALLAGSLASVRIPPWSWIALALLCAAAAAVAEDRYRGLGHAVLPGTPTWLITRHGSLDRDRDCLEAPGIIGWTVRQTYFQRRAGLATLTAATAAGKKRYHVVDVPIERAWALIEAVTPGQLGHR
ncbi:PH domain-containing protein [Nocardia sp. CDC159]|uniref:PH domain-containing protein n=1 Tax=Nocardia pulmonis TaxID=2951408 RepID=A0A9X2IXC4_9NOCA|nr:MULTISPECIES: PH domain-containing protein [Nocardia]MCM6775882.1 PH domain-containing protein [Nocardia pulmonis]MCM6788142.1 PH domain-containing protein [Nocardia sp. CDC159]